MKNIVLSLALFFVFTSAAQAEYDSRKYLPDYVPYNYTDAVEMIDFDECQIPLDKFDEAYFELEWKVIPGSDEGTIFYRYEESDPSGITSLNQLKDRVESEIRDCVADYPDYIAKKKAEQAEKMKALEAKEKSEERARQISIALERCDFEFFGTFSTDEKMQTYDEREACETKVNESVPVEIAPVSVPVPVQQISTSYIPSTSVEVPVQEPTETEVADIISTTTEATITQEKIELTPEELNRIVEEKLNEKLSEAQPEPELEEKPSFFRRLTNFLFGWLF